VTITIAERSIAEEAVLPDKLSFKTAEDMAGDVVSIDETKGIVTAIVSVTGVVDEVDDIIVPGAYAETLTKRNPKVCWAHSWEHPIGKVLAIEELMPGDPRLPSKTRDGKPWPREAGALVASMQFNLRTDEGKNAFEVVRFYSESGECEYSIGYQVPPGKATKNAQGIRLIKMLELYELSVVLFGAHTMTGTLSIKDAARAMIEVKRVIGRGAIDFAALGTKGGMSVSRRAGTGEMKAPVPPQFQKDDEEQEPTGDAPPADEAKGDPCTCCGGSGEHACGHECYACDAAGTLADQAEYDGGVEPGQPLVCEGHHGRPDPDPEATHEPDEVSPDSAPPGTPTMPQEGEEPADGEEGEEEATEPAEGEEGDEGGPTEGTRPPVTAPAAGTGEEEPTGHPDFSDGIMVAVYPDPAAADAIAAHIAGPDDTTPREELHVTLAYLGKIGDGDAPSEQEVVDAVTRAVEGQPALQGEVGGIGQFPADENAEHEGGAPTWAPVDVPGLNMLREQIVSELGDAVYNDHGFTPHMTLGYGIGIIDPVPPTPISINEVRVVYGNSQRGITLGAPVPEAKHRILFTEQEPPEVEAKAGLYWFRTSDAQMHKHDGTEWKATDAMTALPTAADKPAAKAYDPALDRRAASSIEFMAKQTAAFLDAEAKAEGGADRNRGGAEELRRYWTTGEGGAKIGWGTPGDFTRCVALLEEHMPGRAEGYCANRHKEMNGYWPGDDRNKDAGAATETKGDLAVPAAGKSYPQMPGSFEETQQALRDAIAAQYEDDVDDHGHPNVWIDVRATWPDRVLYSVMRMGMVDDCTHFLATYVDNDGSIEFTSSEEVELSIVPVPVDGEDYDEDEVPIGDALPLVEDVMAVVANVKTAQRAMEGKAGRVLSGANERALRTALQHLIAVLAGAGIDLGDVDPENPRPTGNSGSSGDVRREMDPAVDVGTTSPAGAVKDAQNGTETKHLGGEMLTIDMEAHRRLMAEIAAETADV